MLRALQLASQRDYSVMHMRDTILLDNTARLLDQLILGNLVVRQAAARRVAPLSGSANVLPVLNFQAMRL